MKFWIQEDIYIYVRINLQTAENVIHNSFSRPFSHSLDRFWRLLYYMLMAFAASPSSQIPPCNVSDTANAAVPVVFHSNIHCGENGPHDTSTIVTVAPCMPTESWPTKCSPNARSSWLRLYHFDRVPVVSASRPGALQVQVRLRTNWFCRVHFKQWPAQRWSNQKKKKKDLTERLHFMFISSQCWLAVQVISCCAREKKTTLKDTDWQGY